MANSFNQSTIWSKKALTNLDAMSVMAKLVSTQYDADIKNAGDTVKATLFGNGTVATYTPGSDQPPVAFSSTDYSFPIDQIKGFNFVIDRVEDKQSHHNLFQKAIDRHMVAMAQTIDDRLLGHYADVAAGNVIGSAASPITLTKDNIPEYFGEAWSLLKQANVNMNDPLYAVVDVETAKLIRLNPDYRHATAQGDEMIKKGVITEVEGFKVVVSNRIATSSGIKNLMFFHPEYIQFAAQIPEGSVKEYEPQYQHGKGGKGVCLYGSKVFLTTAGVTLKKTA